MLKCRYDVQDFYLAFVNWAKQSAPGEQISSQGSAPQLSSAAAQPPQPAAAEPVPVEFAGLDHYIFNTILPFLVGYFHTSYDAVEASKKSASPIFCM